ncbi:MAG: multidrug effflux MFS transporter, partial [Burkholderiales bacterium]
LLAALTTLSAFATDAFVPALGAITTSLAATPLQTQQVLAAYMLGLAAMALWHGAISDAVGRRPVVLVALAVYALMATGCAFAPNVSILIAFRFCQGLAGGAGMIIARAIVRDRFEGHEAQRLLSTIMVLFTAAPAIAPIIGGWLLAGLGWRSICWFLAGGGVLLFVWALVALPETLPRAQRHSMRPGALARGYWSVFREPRFHALTLMTACAFQVFLQYVGAAYPFVRRELGLGETQFAYLFLPMVTGFMLGSMLSGRVAGRWSRERTIRIAFVLIFGSVMWNVLYHAVWPPSLVPSLAPLMVSALGIALLSPASQLMVLDLFPDRRGMATSCQAALQLGIGAVNISLIAIALSGSAFTLALGQLGWAALALAAWVTYRRIGR